jgi:hypothetical protein
MLDEFRDDLVSYLGSDTADPERVVVTRRACASRRTRPTNVLIVMHPALES